MRLKKKDFSSVTKSKNGMEYKKLNLPLTSAPGVTYGAWHYDMTDRSTSNSIYIERMHSHNFYFVAWTKDCSCDLFVDMDSYKLTDNTLIFMNAGQFHFYKNVVRCIGVMFCFTEDFFTSLQPNVARTMKHDLFNKIHILKITEHETEERLDKICEVMMPIMQGDDESGIAKAAAYSLMSSFLCCTMTTPEYKATIKLQDGELPKRRDLYVHFLDLVERDFARKHLVREYLDELHVSQKLLSICTNDNAGETPLAIINDRLLLEAKRQLLYTDMRVKEIASKLGFDDPAHFVKFFKKHLCASPSDFRTNTVIPSPED